MPEAGSWGPVGGQKHRLRGTFASATPQEIYWAYISEFTWFYITVITTLPVVPLGAMVH